MASTAKKALKGSGKRRRYRGKTVMMVKVRGGWDAVPRSHTHGGHSPARAGFSVGDTAVAAVPTKNLKGQFKVSEPKRRRDRKGFYRPVVTA